MNFQFSDYVSIDVINILDFRTFMMKKYDTKLFLD